MLNIGDKMPLTLGPDADGKEVKLSDFPDKKFIIYFYPKDNTSGCSIEAENLRDNYQLFLEMGYQIIGVSKDSQASHKKFADKYFLPFPLIELMISELTIGIVTSQRQKICQSDTKI